MSVGDTGVGIDPSNADRVFDRLFTTKSQGMGMGLAICRSIIKVYPVGVQLIWPVAARGRPRQRHVPDILSMPAEDMLANAKWQTVSWRTGTKGRLKARFAAIRVRTADGSP